MGQSLSFLWSFIVLSTTVSSSSFSITLLGSLGGGGCIAGGSGALFALSVRSLAVFSEMHSLHRKTRPISGFTFESLKQL